MFYDGTVDADSDVLRTGGVPLAPADFQWPTCAECEGALQFIAHLPIEAGVVSVFMCQNDPGLCDEWEAFKGGNQAYLFTDRNLAPATVPNEGMTQLGAVSRLRPEAIDVDEYFEALSAWEGTGRERTVLGQLGGKPAWIQADQTPSCPGCGTAMTLTAQLEEGYEDGTSGNFGGGGLAYIFHCVDCIKAAFLWQQ